MIKLEHLIETTNNIRTQANYRVKDPLHDAAHMEAIIVISESILAELNKLKRILSSFHITMRKVVLIQMINEMIDIIKQDDYSPFQLLALHLKGLIKGIK